jgi:hypothetical protein
MHAVNYTVSWQRLLLGRIRCKESVGGVWQHTPKMRSDCDSRHAGQWRRRYFGAEARAAGALTVRHVENLLIMIVAMITAVIIFRPIGGCSMAAPCARLFSIDRQISRSRGRTSPIVPACHLWTVRVHLRGDLRPELGAAYDSDRRWIAIRDAVFTGRGFIQSPASIEIPATERQQRRLCLVPRDNLFLKSKAFSCDEHSSNTGRLCKQQRHE